MANTYTGQAAGDWFDPANWSAGVVPAPGDSVDIFGSYGPDATSGTVSGVSIDVSGVAGNDGFNATPELLAATLGTASAPVSINVTADAGAASNAFLTFETLNGSLNVADGQTLSISGATADSFQTETINGDVTVGAGATLSFTGYVLEREETEYPRVVFNGQVDVNGGTLLIASDQVTGTGDLRIADGGTVDFEQTITQYSPDVAITFAPSGGTVVLTYDFTLPGTISGFGTGDAIQGWVANVGTLQETYANNVLTLRDLRGGTNGPAETFTFAGNYTVANFAVSANGEITFQPCFAAGTSIQTPDGARSVEALAAGDAVTLATGGVGTVVWVGHRRQVGGEVVRVRAGALARGVPARDLLVSSDHALFVEGVLVQAGLLADGQTIVRERRDVVFHHVELERHGVLLAEGAPAESYLDTGNRDQFANCPLGWSALDAAANDPCADMVFGGPRLDEIRMRLQSVGCAV